MNRCTNFHEMLQEHVSSWRKSELTMYRILVMIGFGIQIQDRIFGILTTAR